MMTMMSANAPVKRLKGQQPKLRTVTEIVNSDEKLHKDYDLADFDAKNLNSLESVDSLKIKLVIAKYMAMLQTQKLTQNLLNIFRDRRPPYQDIITVVTATLAFIHERVNPLVKYFDSRLEFIVLDNRDNSIPGEPVWFRQNEDDVIVCIIDRLSIVKILERQFDTQIDVGNAVKEENHLKLLQTFSSSGKKRRLSVEEFGAYDINLSELECTQYVTLLFILEHAYGHYSILKNHDVDSYVRSLLDHTLFSNKCKPTLTMNFSNLLLSKLKFSVEDKSAASTAAGSMTCGILNYKNY